MDLVEIERIKQLKARYFRYMDTKQWDKWAMVWAEDAELHNPSARPEPMRGRAEIVQRVSTSLEGATTVHHGHMPEIEVLGPTSAQGVWAMYDLVILPAGLGTGRRMVGNGHYIERYRKDPDGQWRIVRLELRRLHVEMTTIERSTDPNAFYD